MAMTIISHFVPCERRRIAVTVMYNEGEFFDLGSK